MLLDSLKENSLKFIEEFEYLFNSLEDSSDEDSLEELF